MIQLKKESAISIRHLLHLSGICNRLLAPHGKGGSAVDLAWAPGRETAFHIIAQLCDGHARNSVSAVQFHGLLSAAVHALTLEVRDRYGLEQF